MQRVIYKVHYEVMINGNNSAVSGYPKAFDSKNYNNDTDKAFARAEGAYHQAIADACAVYESREQQTVYLVDSAGNQRWCWSKGELAPVEPPVTEVEPPVAEGE